MLSAKATGLQHDRGHRHQPCQGHVAVVRLLLLLVLRMMMVVVIARVYTKGCVCVQC